MALDGMLVDILGRLAALETQLARQQTSENPGNGAAGTVLKANGWGQILTANISADQITAALIAAGAVGTSEIANDAVTAAQIAADAVGASEIAAGAVGASEIASGVVATTHLVANAATQMVYAGLSGTTTAAPYVAHGSASLTTLSGSLCFLLVSEVATPSVNATMQWAWNVDGGGNVLGDIFVGTAAHGVGFVVPLALAAGAHTVNVVWGTSAGTLTSNGGNMIVAELRR